MFHYGIHGNFTPKTSFHWYLLCFLSGSVNAGGILACGRFVTHTTGFFTLSGVDFANGNWLDAIGILTVPGFFICGVMISAYLIEWKRHRGLIPNYSMAMVVAGTFLLGAAFTGRQELFGTFGDTLSAKYDYILMALLSVASGVQNAAITASSGATVRTTHLTGITTDLGIGLIEALANLRDRKRRTSINRKNRLRFGSMLSFLVGGTVGAILFVRLKYLGFLLPSLVAFYAGFIGRRYSKMQK